MPTSIPLTFRAAPFTEGYKADPEQFKNDLVARLYAESTEAISFFAAGSVAPSSNVGPWLKNNETWYVWDNGLAMYVPQVIDAASLGYIASLAAPDQTIYTFWIELNGAGKALAVKYYSGGAWKDVYEDKFLTYSTTTQMNAAIAAAIAAIPPSTFDAYVGTATLNVAQSIPIDGAAHKMTLDTAIINTAGGFNIVASRYIALADGAYHLDVSSQFDNSTGTASGMQVICGVYKNGLVATEGIGSFNSTPSPNVSQWAVAFGGIIELLQNDYIEIWATINDGVNTGAIDLTTWDFSVHRVSA